MILWNKSILKITFQEIKTFGNAIPNFDTLITDRFVAMQFTQENFVPFTKQFY